MAENPGVYPLNKDTEVGRFRLLVGDVTSEPFDPPRAGIQNYKLFSDAEIETFLALGESQEMAAYYAFMQLASSAALTSSSVTDYDLKIDTTKTPGELRLIAQGWRERADSLSADVFELADVSIRDEDCHPELSAWPVRGNCGFRLF